VYAARNPGKSCWLPFARSRSVSKDNSSSASAPESEPRTSTTTRQGLTLAHSSAQLERFVWDRGCA
jgi:hypothetical protein